MVVLSRVGDDETEDRALGHLRNCIPEVCAALSESELREVIRWGQWVGRGESHRPFLRWLPAAAVITTAVTFAMVAPHGKRLIAAVAIAQVGSSDKPVALDATP